MEFSCEGSLISEKFILSNTFNLDSEKQEKTVAKLGHVFNNEHNYAVKTIIQHPDFYPRFGANDISLTELMEPIKFSELIKPACLSIHSDVDALFKKILTWTSTITI